MVRITAYHVSANADLDIVQRGVCDDENRDGLLYGANVASFTTTRYEGRLPDFSPYPREAGEGTTGYRYVMKFNPDDYFKFLMAESSADGVKQVHYLLLAKRDRRDERVLARLVRACIRTREDQDWDEYFPNGRANDYHRDSNQYVGRVFVNVMFWHDVRVNEPTTGHEVPKRGPTFGRDPVTQVSVWLENLLAQAIGETAEEDDDVDALTAGMRSLQA